MKSILNVIIGLAALGTSVILAGAVHAEEKSAVSDKSLVKELSQYVVVINRPIYIYNWFNAGGHSPIWTSPMSSNDYIGYQHVANSARNYFQSFCINDPSRDPADCTSEDVNTMFGRGNMYGPGFYGATDPVSTAGYGSSDQWILLQVQLPKKFRIASLVWEVKNDSLSQKAQDEFKNMGCGFLGPQTSARTLLDQMLQWGNSNQGKNDLDSDKQECTLSIRRILKERLKIDGLYYNYTGSSFAECSDYVVTGTTENAKTPGNTLRMGAFVIANVDKLKPSEVKVFNSLTTDAMKDRVRITSLFYKVGNAPTSSGFLITPAIQAAIQYYNLNGIPGYPGLKVQQWLANLCYTYGAFTNVCGDWYMVIDSTGATQLMPIPLPPAGVAPVATPTPAQEPVDKISSSKLPVSLSQYHQKLLWADLDGHDQDPDLGKWIKKSLLGCQDVAPFGVVPNLRYNRFYPTSESDKATEK
jgi:hypothetical protein